MKKSFKPPFEMGVGNFDVKTIFKLKKYKERILKMENNNIQNIVHGFKVFNPD